jgi:hypothetical protein
MTDLLALPWFAENVHRLALGIEPLDAMRRQRVAHRLELEVEGPSATAAAARFARHDSCLHALLYRPGIGTHVHIRIVDRTRRFVPRRLRIPLPDFAADGNPPLAQRTRRPALFPGAAYDAPAAATGLRGSVRRGAAPLRWARVEARRPGTGVVVGRAFGDDRGEFLLLLAPAAMQAGDLTTPLPIDVVVFGPAEAPAAEPADELWGVPLEPLPDAAVPDDVASGETLPTGYTATVTQVVDFVPGRMLSREVGEFVIP